MKQLDIFATDYESANYTKTSQDALATIKPKIKTKRQQVYEFVKSKASTNYEISDELEIPLSSVCARVRELQVLNLLVLNVIKIILTFFIRTLILILHIKIQSNFLKQLMEFVL